MINSTVVDNELFGTDLGVTLSWKAKLKTEYAKLCTVRWSGALLCVLPDLDAIVGRMDSASFQEFLSSKLEGARYYLKHVKFDLGEEGGGTERTSFELILMSNLIVQPVGVRCRGKPSHTMRK